MPPHGAEESPTPWSGLFSFGHHVSPVWEPVPLPARFRPGDAVFQYGIFDQLFWDFCGYYLLKLYNLPCSHSYRVRNCACVNQSDRVYNIPMAPLQKTLETTAYR